MEPVVVGPFLVVLVVASSCWDGSVVMVIDYCNVCGFGRDSGVECW